MPDPSRLLILTELREQAGLTLADMAQRCGLKGRQSRKTVAAWEQGNAVPRARWRANVASFLLHDLNLAQSPEKLEEVWAVLVEEWAWEPLTPTELDLYPNGANTGTSVDKTPPANSAAADSRMDADIQTAQIETDFAEFRSRPGYLQRRQPLLQVGLLAAFLLAVGYIYIPHIYVTQWQNEPPQVHVPENLGFEMDTIAPWVALNEDACAVEVRNDGGDLPDGDRYLHFRKGSSDCFSVHQDRTVTPSAETRNFAVWLRSPDGRPRTGAVVLWPGIDPLEEHGVNEEEKRVAAFNIVGDEWHCIEAAIVIDNPTYTVMRGAVYVDGVDGADLWLDNASFYDGQTSACPPRRLELRDPGFEFDHALNGWRWLAEPAHCHFLTVSNDADAVAGNHFLSVVKRNEQCTSAYQDVAAPVAQGQKVRIATWVRSGKDEAIDGQLTLWMIDDREERQSSHRPFRVDKHWTCVETTLVNAQPDVQRVRVELYFNADVEAVYDFDQLMLSMADDPLCPEQNAEVFRSAFDAPRELDLWEWQGRCEFSIVDDASTAVAGAGYLKLSRERIDCLSFYRNVLALPKAGETYTVLMWLRSPSAAPRKGRLLVRARGDGDEYGELLFTVENQAWTCLETSLTIVRPNHLSLWAEIYLDSVDGADYEFDEIALYRGAERRCPQAYLDIRSSRILMEPAESYAGSSVAVQAEVRNTNQSEPVDNAQLAFWISDQPNGSHIGPIVRRPISHLEPGASTQPIRADVQLDLGLKPEKDYFIVFDLYADTPVQDRDRTLRRDSRSIDILPCEPDMLFCDVSATHWARAEIEAWYENGITTGCNSAGVPFESLTFCPELSVERWMFSVFFQRHKYGGDYRPAGPYEQLFADATADLPFVVWVEDAAKDGLVLDSAHCAPNDGQSYFCPLAPLRRIDLLRALSSVDQFDLATVEGSRYGDLAMGSAEAKTADYLWRQGFLFAQDLFCPQTVDAPNFCPDAPVRRAEVAYIMARAFSMVDAP